MASDGVPSAGWKSVYASMDASTDAEGEAPDERACPDCGADSLRLRGLRYRCPTHGTWRAARARS